MYKIVASPTFKLCLNRLVYFLTKKYSSKCALDTKQHIRKAIGYLADNPYLAPVSERLIDLGIKEYHQYLVDENNIVFYHVDEDKHQVILLAVMDSRQSIQKLLSEVMLLS